MDATCKHDIDFDRLDDAARAFTVEQCKAGEYDQVYAGATADDPATRGSVSVSPALPDADKNGWHKQDVWRNTPGGGYGGDDRIGTSYSASYWREAGNVFLVIDEEYYVAFHAPDADKPHGSLGCEAAYTYTACRDYNNPGGTELWSTSDYEGPGDLTALYRSTLRIAEDVCRRWALSDQRWTLTWDPAV